MKTNRVIFYFLSTLLLVSCGNKVKTPVYELGDKKDVMGSGLLFSETIGFNTKDATIFEENKQKLLDENVVLYFICYSFLLILELISLLLNHKMNEFYKNFNQTVIRECLLLSNITFN